MTQFAFVSGVRLQQSRRLLATFGIGLIALGVIAVAGVVQSISGSFTSFVVVNAELPSAGNAIQIDSPVQFRDVTVGTVASDGRPIGGGVVSVVLHMKPSKLGAIPGSVRATVGPLSIFGNQAIQLVTTAGATGASSAPLAAGQTIASLASGPTASLQATLADLDNLLVALHPAEMNSALTALATALRGQGSSLGQTLQRSSVYLHQMLPLLPTFEANLRQFAPVSDYLATSTPDFLGTLSNLTVVNQTYTADQSQLHQLLAGGGALAGQTAQFLTAIQQPWARLLADSGPLFADVTQNSTEIAQILTGLDIWAKAWTASESHGPFLTLSSTLAVPNPADVVRAGLGDPNVDALFAQGIGTNLVNPQTYTPSNCPIRYGAAPSVCTPAGVAAVRAATTASVVVPEPQQQNALTTIATALGNGTPPSSPAVSTLLLAPVLRSMVTQP